VEVCLLSEDDSLPTLQNAMAKAPENPRSAEQLKEVAIFLKQADKLVREGN
jgi:hypothetical protein